MAIGGFAAPSTAVVTGYGRRLVYLDQNVLSELAKLRLGRPVDERRRGAIAGLDEALQAAVFERQDARCIESHFHRSESSGFFKGGARDAAEQIFLKAWELVKTLSWGLEISSFEELLISQTLVTVAARTGLCAYERGKLWRLAFRVDPNEPNEKRGVVVGGQAFLAAIPWRRESLTAGWVARAASLRERGDYLTHEQALSDVRTELRSWAVEQNRWSSWATRWGTATKKMDRADVDAFIASEDFFELPVVHVRTELLARVLSDRRALRTSDRPDVEILTLVVPYCDLVLTDSYMAESAKQLRFSERYGTTVLSTRNEGLVEAARILKLKTSAPPLT